MKPQSLMGLCLAAGLLCPAAGADQDEPQATVLATYEFHQLTHYMPHGVAGTPRNNGLQIAFARPNPRAGQQRATDIMVIGYDGADPQVVDRLEDIWGATVDISHAGPVHVLFTDSWKLRVVRLQAGSNRPAGPAQEILALGSPEIGQIRMLEAPYFLVRRGGGFGGESGGVNRGGVSGKPQNLIGPERMAKELGVGIPDLWSFDEFDVGASAAPGGPRIVFTVVVDGRPSQQPEKSGLWFFSLEGTGPSARLCQVQPGPGDYKAIRLSLDGNKIFYRSNQKIWMLDWPGGGETRLIADDLGDAAPFPDQTGRFVLTSSGHLIDTDTRERRHLFATHLYKECFYLHMDPISMRISMVTRREGVPEQVAILRLNTPVAQLLPGSPRIREYSMAPPGMISDDTRGPGILRAKIEPADRIVRVPWVTLKAGTIDTSSSLYDQDRPDAGFVAGDGVFDGFLTARPDPAVETRVLRIHAESEDAEGKRHAYAIETGPYPVEPLPETPPAASPTQVVPPPEVGSGPAAGGAAATGAGPGPAPAAPGTGTAPTRPGGAAAAGAAATPPASAPGTATAPGQTVPAPGGPAATPATPAGTGAATPPGGAAQQPPYYPQPAFPAAAIGMRIEAENRRVGEGDTVTVPIWLRGAAKVANMNFDVQYDPNVARPEGDVLRGNLLDQAVFNANPSEAGRIRIGFAQIDGLSGDGTVAYLPMRAVGRAGDRTALDLAVTALNDSVGHALPIERTPGSVLVVGPEGQVPGDCDGDESITAADAMCALMMSVGNREVDLRMDVDGNKQVTSNDARLLLRRAVKLTQ